MDEKKRVHVENSLKSLHRLAKQIILVHDRLTDCSAFQQLGETVCVLVENPTMNVVFEAALAHVRQDDIFMYTNSDVVYFDGLQATIQRVSQLARFLVVGRRYDYVWSKEIDFETSGILQALECLILNDGVLHNVWGLDYFIFKKSNWILRLPPYLPGNWRWDNHILSSFLSTSGNIVLDASETVTAFHQSSTGVINIADRNGAQINDALVKNSIGQRYIAGNIEEVDVKLSRHDFRMTASIQYCLQSIIQRAIRCALENTLTDEKYTHVTLKVVLPRVSHFIDEQLIAVQLPEVGHVHLQNGKLLCQNEARIGGTRFMFLGKEHETIVSMGMFTATLTERMLRAGFNVELVEQYRYNSYLGSHIDSITNEINDRKYWRRVKDCVHKEMKIHARRPEIGLFGSTKACVRKLRNKSFLNVSYMYILGIFIMFASLPGIIKSVLKGRGRSRHALRRRLMMLRR